jgi:archaellum component FlaF (FlaF/FlaG flagellin family)
VNYQGNTGELYMLDIDTGAKTILFPTYIEGTATAYHISGKSFAKPGWVLMSTYARFGAEKWLHERVMAVELKADPTIINIAHHRTKYNGYWTEPHASVNRDFSRVFFTSNWGSGSDTDVDAYMVRLPNNLFGASTPVADAIAPSVEASTAGSNGTITLIANASDNVGVSEVEFLIDGVLVGSDATSPYTLAIDSTALASGAYTLSAVAYDAAGNAGVSPTVSFSVNNVTADSTAPSVSASATGTSGTIAFSANASDNTGVTRVDFLVDGVAKGSDSSGPYTLSLDSTTLSNASHTLVAKAVDAAGNVGTSASVSFAVNNTPTTTSVDNSLVIAQMKSRLDSMDATLAKMSSTNKNVKALKSDVSTQRTLVGQIK